MATQIIGGPRMWGGAQDSEGHRDYTIVHQVKGEKTDGPYNVMRTAGLPVPGSSWLFDGDLDIWAWCAKDIKLTSRLGDGEPTEYWDVEQKFTTRFIKRCQDEQVEDPLLREPLLSGSFIKSQKEATYDRYGNPTFNSAFEQLRGPSIEFDDSQPQVVFEENVLDLDYGFVRSKVDNLNSGLMWGLPRRSVKLSDFQWERKYYGSCYKYYTRKLTFDIRVKKLETGLAGLGFPTNGPFPIVAAGLSLLTLLASGYAVLLPTGTVIVGDWDRDVMDEATKALIGRWDENKGTGCTVDVTADADGKITAAVLNAPGSAYPRSCIVPLKVAGGTGGVILVETDAGGVVTSNQRVHLAGTGYTTTAGVATTQRGQYVVTRFNGTGAIPDPANPQHFCRVKDKKGENMRVILDGNGLPIGEDEDSGYIHVEKYPETSFFELSARFPTTF